MIKVVGVIRNLPQWLMNCVVLVRGSRVSFLFSQSIQEKQEKDKSTAKVDPFLLMAHDAFHHFSPLALNHTLLKKPKQNSGTKIKWEPGSIPTPSPSPGPSDIPFGFTPKFLGAVKKRRIMAARE